MDKKIMYCQVAGLTYEIEYLYPYIEKMYKDYIVDKDSIKKSDEIIQISYSDEDFNRKKDSFEVEYSPGYIEHTCIMEKIASGLPEYGRLLMHGATIEYNGKAYIFTAPSGTGKSTHISLWKKHLGEKVNIINGDKPELSFEDGNVFVHGAPWCGKEGWQINTSASLAGVCIVTRGDVNEIKEIHPGENIEFFMKQLYIAEGPDYLIKIVDLFKKMAEAVPFYELKCDISEGAAKCSFEAMTGEKWNED